MGAHPTHKGVGKIHANYSLSVQGEGFRDLYALMFSPRIFENIYIPKPMYKHMFEWFKFEMLAQGTLKPNCYPLMVASWPNLSSFS